MKRSDITDEQVVQACVDAALLPTTAGDLLMKRTGAPWKVAEGAMYRTARRGLIDYGVSLWHAFPTLEGRKLLGRTA